jgi:hypothetical protein
VFGLKGTSAVSDSSPDLFVALDLSRLFAARVFPWAAMKD